MNDTTKVAAVTIAYVKMLRAMRGGFVKKLPPTTGKLFYNCVQFFDASVEMNVGVYPMMLVGLEQYSEGWLRKTFGNGYPPFNLITGPKCLEWIRRQMPKSVSFGNVDQVADGIMDSLKNVDRTTAMELIESGVVCGENRLLKETLLGRLQWAKSTVLHEST